ncbi:MAG: AAA domain-containing protein, partial [Candidatus Diapherotrites archaeon]|nr:AAA domain-containing protein [Candidatus Diapherotrites archaeon]
MPSKRAKSKKSPSKKARATRKRVVKKKAEPLLSLKFKTTKDIKVSKLLSGQVLGQDPALDVVKKASKQYRNVLLIGTPGTGKSMLAQSMSELLPLTKLKDLLIYSNDGDPNTPKVKVVPAGQGKAIMTKARLNAASQLQNASMVVMVVGFILLAFLSYAYFHLGWYTDVVYVGYMLMSVLFLISLSVGSRTMMNPKSSAPKLLVDNAKKRKAPFVDASGARAGALLGDVRHDPLQSGGLGTPAFLRVEPGA